MVTAVIGTLCLLMILAWVGRAQEGGMTADGKIIIEPPPQMIETEWVPLELERMDPQPLTALPCSAPRP